MKNQHKGILYILLAACSFALMNMFVRLSGDLPSMQKSFFRNFISLIMASAILLRKKEPIKLPKGSGKYLLLRATFGTIGILCNFYAVDHLLLADASMLAKMSPFFTILFSYLILKEKITPFQGFAVVCAFLGCLFVIKPSFSGMELLPFISGMCGGMAAGMAYTLVRKLGEMGVNKTFIVFFFSSFSCLVALPFLILQFEPMTMKQFGMLILAGVAAMGGQVGVTMGYCYAPAKEITVYDYSQILFSALLGFLVFGDVPDIWNWVGYGVIITIAILLYLHNNKGMFHGKKHQTAEN